MAGVRDRGPRSPRRRTSRTGEAAGTEGGAGVSAERPDGSSPRRPTAGPWGPGKRSSLRLLLAAPNELVQRDTVHLDDLVPDPGDVPVGPAHPAADAFDEHLVVLIDEIDGAVAHSECGDLASVLDELDLDA